MTDFNGFGLPQALAQNLEQMQYKTPTEIQAQAIPIAMEGKDVLGSAQTGTGKTAAFSIPILAKLLTNPRGSALILLPTRELAVQVTDVIKKMAGNSGIKTALLIGGESMQKQFAQLKARPRIFVGTPGRINDHLERGTLLLHDTTTIVLDETDRMLDMGFGIQLERIAKFLPKVRQTMMFSATIPHNIMKLAEKYLNQPVRISVGQQNSAVEKITQDVIHTTDADKYQALVNELNSRQGSIIVFVKTKWGARKMAEKLCKQNHSAHAIHGDLMQKKRDQAIAAFRAQKFRIMVATDVAARGLDIPHIEHVINYDLPQAPEDYIHRIGRTARAGATGSALCLVTPEDRGKLRAINRLMGIEDNSSASEGGERRRKSSGGRNRKFGGWKGGRGERSENRGERNHGERNERNDRGNGGERKARSENGFGGERKDNRFGGERSGGDNRRNERNGEKRSDSFGNGGRDNRYAEKRNDSGNRDKSSNKPFHKPSGDKPAKPFGRFKRRFGSKAA